MKDILKLARLQLVFIVLFVFFKLLRGVVLESDPSNFLKVVFLSLPNFFEAVVGTLILTGIGLYLNLKLRPSKPVKRHLIYILAAVLAGIYVITQEFNLHGLGGNNFYDPYDLLFSVIGLFTGFTIVLRIQPRIQKEDV